MKRANQPQTLKQKMYEEISAAILTGQYPAESTLTEKALVEKYCISKSPIREALIELCNEGFIRSIPRFGYEVLRVDYEEVQQAREARIIIECGAMKEGFERITPVQLDTLFSLLEDSDETDAFAHWQRNLHFHKTLIMCYDNEVLDKLFMNVMTIIQRDVIQRNTQRHDRRPYPGVKNGKHLEILQAIQAGDKEQAIKALFDDIKDWKNSD